MELTRINTCHEGQFFFLSVFEFERILEGLYFLNIEKQTFSIPHFIGVPYKVVWRCTLSRELLLHLVKEYVGARYKVHLATHYEEIGFKHILYKFLLQCFESVFNHIEYLI